jgi:hypothetical protein
VLLNFSRTLRVQFVVICTRSLAFAEILHAALHLGYLLLKFIDAFLDMGNVVGQLSLRSVITEQFGLAKAYFDRPVARWGLRRVNRVRTGLGTQPDRDPLDSLRMAKIGREEIKSNSNVDFGGSVGTRSPDHGEPVKG